MPGCVRGLSAFSTSNCVRCFEIPLRLRFTTKVIKLKTDADNCYDATVPARIAFIFS